MSSVYEPQSASYRKALRNHLKSTRQRLPNDTYDWTPFRAAEKKYKARFPPPDLSNVLDLALLEDERMAEVTCSRWKGRSNAVQVTSVRVRADAGDIVSPGRKRKAFSVPQIPGLVLLPGYLSPEGQKELVRWSLCDHARWPNESNLDTHYVIPKEGVWNRHLQSRRSQITDPDHVEEFIQPRALCNEAAAAASEPPGPRQLVSNTPADLTNFRDLSKQPKPPAMPSHTLQPTTASDLLPKLRWANIGWSYHWGTKQYDFGKQKVGVGELVSRICRNVVRSIDWGDVFAGEQGGTIDTNQEDGFEWSMWDSTYEPDAGIVNFYQLKDTLMGHVDRSEVCSTSPLVSISLGNAAVFLIGGLSRDVEPVPILLRSGDIVIMAGPRCRRAYHGVPRILEGSLPTYLLSSGADDEWTPFGRYLQTTRINVNVRQVFPKGFDPLDAGRND